jgi:hypothetical protein
MKNSKPINSFGLSLDFSDFHFSKFIKFSKKLNRADWFRWTNKTALVSFHKNRPVFIDIVIHADYLIPITRNNGWLDWWMNNSLNGLHIHEHQD